jgi:hypothetical protein
VGLVPPDRRAGREGRARHHRGVDDAEPGTEARKIGDLFASFMDTERIEGSARAARGPARRVDAIDSIPALLRTSARWSARASAA